MIPVGSDLNYYRYTILSVIIEEWECNYYWQRQQRQAWIMTPCDFCSRGASSQSDWKKERLTKELTKLWQDWALLHVTTALHIRRRKSHRSAQANCSVLITTLQVWVLFTIHMLQLISRHIIGLISSDHGSNPHHHLWALSFNMRVEGIPYNIFKSKRTQRQEVMPNGSVHLLVLSTSWTVAVRLIPISFNPRR